MGSQTVPSGPCGRPPCRTARRGAAGFQGRPHRCGVRRSSQILASLGGVCPADGRARLCRGQERFHRVPKRRGQAGTLSGAAFRAGPEGSLRAAREATTTIPIVAVAIDYDPIARGYVAGLARPGGNITGVFLRQPELTAKRVELLREVVPKVRRMAVFWDVFSADQLQETEAIARSIALQVERFEFRNPPYHF